jgi:hypothetical protein
MRACRLAPDNRDCRRIARPRDPEEPQMPRYLVERRFPDGLHIPLDASGAQVCNAVVDRNSPRA